MITSLFNSNNKLFTQTKQAKWLTPIWLAIPVAFGFVMFSALGGIISFVIRLIIGDLILKEILMLNPNSTTLVNDALVILAPKTALGQTLELISNFGGIYLGVWFWVKMVEKRPFKTVGLDINRPLFKLGRGVIVGFGLFASTMGLMILIGVYRFEGISSFSFGLVSGILLVLLGWFVQGPAEELIFRGWLLPVISVQHKLWLGVVISSVVFALLHGFNPGITLIALLNLCLFGLFAAFYAIVEESIWGVCGVHAIWNWTQGNIFGLEVSGLAPAGGSLMVLQEDGPDWLTGGAFGPEGGLGITLILVSGIIILLLLNRQKIMAKREFEG